MKKRLILLPLFLVACSPAKTSGDNKSSHQVVTIYADKVNQTIEEHYQQGYYLNEHIDLGNRGMVYILCFEK